MWSSPKTEKQQQQQQQQQQKNKKKQQQQKLRPKMPYLGIFKLLI